MRSSTLRQDVIEAARFVGEYATIQTHVGGGMHPVSAQLWAYLLAIHKAYGVRGNLLEIGVFKGWGLYIPAKYRRPDERLILVDIAAHFLQESKEFLRDRAGVPEEAMELVQTDSVFQETMDRLVQGQTRVRFAHIDGEHSYSAVQADLSTVARRACAEAIIVVDDVDLAHSTCVNDAMLDWLAVNRSWRLAMRGYNKAYIVSARSRIPWRSHLEFMPDILERHFQTRAMLASQTSSTDTPYYSIGAPVGSARYQTVGRTMEALEEFDEYAPRSALLGQTCRATLGVVGSSQGRCVADLLTLMLNTIGMDLRVEYLGSVDEVLSGASTGTAGPAKSLEVALVLSSRLLGHKVATAAEVSAATGAHWVIRAADLEYEGYWPNRLVGGHDDVSRPAPIDDLVILAGLKIGLGDEEIVKAAASTQTFAHESVRHWASESLRRVSDYEEACGMDVRTGGLLEQWLAARGERACYSARCPTEELLADFGRLLVLVLASRFEARNEEALRALAEGSRRPRNPVQLPGGFDEAPLPSVTLALNLREPPWGSGADRPLFRKSLVPPRAGGIDVTWEQEIARCRGVFTAMSCGEREQAGATLVTLAQRAPDMGARRTNE